MKKGRLPPEEPLAQNHHRRRGRRRLPAAALSIRRLTCHSILAVVLLTNPSITSHTTMFISALILPSKSRQSLRWAAGRLAQCQAQKPVRWQHQIRLFQQQDAQINDNNNSYNAKYQQLMDASTLSLAPMMEYTDRHFRHLVRLISNRTLLYTEMVAANAIAHERRHHLTNYLETHPDVDYETARLLYDDAYLQRFLAQGRQGVVVSSSSPQLEGPSVLQLGGSDPDTLYEASLAVWELTQRSRCSSSSSSSSSSNTNSICDYTALNLNCGCPSPKVAGKGCFGAALMEEPHLVASLARAMHDGCNGALPVTVKCRIGTDLNYQQGFSKQGYAQVDPQQEYGELCRFIETVAADGIVTDFQIHARIAVLQKSFSPADNRKIPPLKYDVVRRLVQDYPDLTFSLNGGIETISGVQSELQAAPGLRGVMIGRAWAADPWSFAMADELLYGEAPATRNRWDILQEYGKHADAEELKGDPVRIRRFIVKAIMPLFAGEPNAKRYRIALDDIAGMPKKLQSQGKSVEDGQPPLSVLILDAAAKHLSEDTLFRSPQESYERVLWEESKRRQSDNGICRSQAVTEWQTLRSEQAAHTA